VAPACAVRRDGRTGASYEPVFFTPEEWETVRDAGGPDPSRRRPLGSATDAGVPEFMDFILDENERLQIPIRGGLAWLDTECRRRFGEAFSAVRRGPADGGPRRHRMARAGGAGALRTASPSSTASVT
jgi:hypothetical protein